MPRIIYIHHNCFVLEAGERTLLFDYPAPAYLPEAAAGVQPHLRRMLEAVLAFAARR